MSALHAVLTTDRIAILADSAAFVVATGVVAGFQRKIVVHPTLPIAIGSVGLVEHLEIGRAILEDPECNASFNDIVESLRALLAAGETLAERRPDLVPFGEILVAGFDDGRARMTAAHFGDVEPALNPPGRKAHAVEEIELPAHGIAEFARGPNLTPDLSAELQRLIEDNRHRGTGMLRAIGAEYFGLMRRAKSVNAAYGSAGEFHAVGGSLDYAEITPAGVSIETIHTWPDKIGEPIRPWTASTR